MADSRVYLDPYFFYRDNKPTTVTTPEPFQRKHGKGL